MRTNRSNAFARDARAARTRRARGFTFIELSIGLVITAMVALAAASFAIAMSTAWQRSTTAEASMLSGHQITTRIQQILRSVRYLGACRLGSLSTSGGTTEAAILIWRADDVTVDGKVQTSEMQLLRYEHDDQDGQGSDAIKLYSPWRTNPAGFTDATWTPTDFADVNKIAAFQAKCKSVVVARAVHGATFAAKGGAAPSPNWTLEFTLKLDHPDGLD